MSENAKCTCHPNDIREKGYSDGCPVHDPLVFMVQHLFPGIDIYPIQPNVPLEKQGFFSKKDLDGVPEDVFKSELDRILKKHADEKAEKYKRQETYQDLEQKKADPFPKELTPGEKAAGVSFNPSKLREVDVIKTLSARLLDALFVEKDKAIKEGNNEKIAQLVLAIRKVMEGKMWAVNAITLQD